MCRWRRQSSSLSSLKRTHDSTTPTKDNDDGVDKTSQVGRRSMGRRVSWIVSLCRPKSRHAPVATKLVPVNDDKDVDVDVDVAWKGQHPALRNLYVMDDQLRRIVPNRVFPVDTEYFEGRGLMMIRTPDADGTSTTATTATATASMSDECLRISEYFRPKKRRFELQFQFRLKRPIPEGTVYFGFEFDRPLYQTNNNNNNSSNSNNYKITTLQRAVINAGLGFVKMTNHGFHYSLTGTGDVSSSSSSHQSEQQQQQKPHLVFPFVACMDRLVATPHGQPLPVLGRAVEEPPSSYQQRYKGIESGHGVQFPGWSMDYTYTACVWSAYVDWIQYQIRNLPGGRPFSLTSLFGDQPVQMAVYVLTNPSNQKEQPKSQQQTKSQPHLQRDKVYVSTVEISNKGKAEGQRMKQWMTSRKRITVN